MLPAILLASARLASGLGADIRNTMAAAAAAREQQQQGVDVYYLNRVADEFSAFASSQQRILDAFHAAEQDRLEVAIQDVFGTEGKAMLEDAAVFNEESRLEARNAFGEMQNFVGTLKQAMGAQGSARSCQELTCGPNGFCVAEAASARCRCTEGYEGNGFVCNTPTSFQPQPLTQINLTEPFPQVADLQVVTLGHNRVAVVFRDTARENRGYLMLGRAMPDRIAWGRPVVFSEGSEAFSPVVAELHASDDAAAPLRLAIAYRDADRGGDGILLGAGYDLATGMVSFTETRLFTRHQAQTMSIVALPGARVALLFAEHALAGRASASIGASGHAAVPAAGQQVPRAHSTMFGAALLARVPAPGQGAPEVIAKQRFISGPVARLSSAQISPTSFVVAYRHSLTSGGVKGGEASCILAQLHGSELIFEPQPLQLEPEHQQVWARNVAALGGGAFLYTYHSGNEQLTKQAVLRVDAQARRLRIVRAPEVVARGFSPIVGSVSTLLAQQSGSAHSTAAPNAKTFTYFSRDGAKAEARLCGGYSLETGVPSQCKEVSWANGELSTASGTPVGDGRIVFVYADRRGVPFYQLVGMDSETAA